MIVVNEIHNFEEIPPQVQHFTVSGSTRLAGHINMRNKGFAEDDESFWFGVFLVFTMCLPFFGYLSLPY